jgi:hypothetical protein
MPSTETRRYADLITLIRETVNDAASEDFGPGVVYGDIWRLANDEEKKALVEFSSWFQQEVNL